MPLHDHFRSPVNDKHSWNEFHGGWPMMLVLQLGALLPPGYQAAPTVHLGSPFEVDIGTYDDDSRVSEFVGSGGGGTATLASVISTLTVEADLTSQDAFEVRVYDTERGRTLVAAIEIVSPSNKDRRANRKLFVGKVASMLEQGVSVTLVDLVSGRQANLYAELLDYLVGTDPHLPDPPPAMYAVTVRARKPPRGRAVLDASFYPLAVGRPLPTLPIWLTPELGILLPLETSYAQTCRALGIAEARPPVR